MDGYGWIWMDMDGSSFPKMEQINVVRKEKGLCPIVFIAPKTPRPQDGFWGCYRCPPGETLSHILPVPRVSRAHGCGRAQPWFTATLCDAVTERSYRHVQTEFNSDITGDGSGFQIFSDCTSWFLYLKMGWTDFGISVKIQCPNFDPDPTIDLISFRFSSAAPETCKLCQRAFIPFID